MAKFPAENSKLQLQTEREVEVEVEAVYGSPPPSAAATCCCHLCRWPDANRKWQRRLRVDVAWSVFNCVQFV